MKRHMCISIQGALRNKAFSGWTDDEGNDLKRSVVKANLEAELAKGRRVLPMGDCDNFDFQTGCKGHPSEDAKP